MIQKILLYILLILFIACPVLAQQVLPSYHQGFVTNSSLSKRPNLWKGLVGIWKPSLGVTGITTLRDISAFKNHGTFNGSMTLDDWVISGNPRLPGYALDFDGGDDFIDLGDKPIFQFERTDPFSISVWVKKDVSGANLFLVAKELSAGTFRGYALSFDNDENLVVFIISTLSNGIQVETVTAFADTTSFHHIAMTYDGSSSVSGVKIYYDGKGEDLNTLSDNLSTTILESVNLQVGTRNSGNQPFNGLIDNVGIYNRALLDSEIKDLFDYPNAMFELRRPVLAKTPAVAPAGIPIFRRRIEHICGKCHDEKMITFKFNEPCERRPELAFSD